MFMAFLWYITTNNENEDKIDTTEKKNRGNEKIIIKYMSSKSRFRSHTIELSTWKSHRKSLPINTKPLIKH